MFIPSIISYIGTTTQQMKIKTLFFFPFLVWNEWSVFYMSNKNYVNIYEEYRQKFYQLPKAFFTNPKYKKLSNNAKIAWSILRDRSSLSKKNKWFDEDTGNVYFIYTNEDLQEILQISSRTTITKVKDELVEAELIEQQRLGFNKPNKLYLLYPEITTEDINKIDELENYEYQQKERESLDNKGCPKNGRPKNEHQDVQKMDTNNTEYINTSNLNTKIDTNTDTNKQKKQQLELLKQFSTTQQEHDFLSQNNLELITLFSNTTKEAENTIGLMLRAKKKAQNDYNTTLVLTSSDPWQDDVEKTLRRLYHKIKTDDRIKQTDNYMFKSFYTTFENMILEKNSLNSNFNHPKVPIHNYLETK